MTEALESQYKMALKNALDTGYDILEKGGTALNVVEIVVKALEDSPLFNAGKGAVFTAEGTHEMDASIMDGKTLHAGAIAAAAQAAAQGRRNSSANGGNCRWATCYDDLCAARVLRFPSLILKNYFYRVAPHTKL